MSITKKGRAKFIQKWIQLILVAWFGMQVIFFCQRISGYRFQMNWLAFTSTKSIRSLTALKIGIDPITTTVAAATAEEIVFRQRTWMYQNKYPIFFEKTSTQTSPQQLLLQEKQITISQPVLLLNGFGMGSFHQHRLMKNLVTNTMDVNEKNNENSDNNINKKVYFPNVYAIDYLGQGKSWPKDCNDGKSIIENGLRYCGNTWADQIIQFIEHVILVENHSTSLSIVPSSSTSTSCVGTKVHLVGNSVGGHLAVYIAASRPDLVESVVLFNPTPVWGLNLPTWDGCLPAPMVPKIIGRLLFDVIRSASVIRQFLKVTYVNQNAYSEQLVQQIRNCTTSPGGHAAFASILWSPPISILLPSTTANNKNTNRYCNNFYDCLKYLQCQTLLCFGKNDPWCKPIFGKKMMESLRQRSFKKVVSEPTSTKRLIQRYVELSNVGHCPNHESPNAASHILKAWVSSIAATTSAVMNQTQQQMTTNGDDDMCEVTNNIHDDLDVNSDSCNVLIHAQDIEESWGVTTIQEKQTSDISLSLFDRLTLKLM